MTTWAITGVSGYIGARLCALLDAAEEVETVIGLDVKPPRETSRKLRFVQQDVRRPFDEHLRGVDVALHLAWILNPIKDSGLMTAVNLGGTRNFLQACAAHGVPRVLAVSSATAYGAAPENPVPMPESWPVRPEQAYQYGREKAIMEGLVRAFADFHPAVAVQIVRPAIVIGPHVDNFISRSLVRAVVPLLAGDDPPMQMIHEEDCARALFELARRGPAGTFNLGADGWLPTSHIAKKFGGRVVRVPLPVGQAIASTGWNLGIAALAEAPPSILDFLRFPWVVDGRALRETLGLTFRYDTLAALQDFAARR